MDSLPIEILDKIAAEDVAVYRALALGYPRYGRSMTPGRVFDYMAAAGYNCRVIRTRHGQCISWTYNGRPHRVNGPAFQYQCGSNIWIYNGSLHRDDGPAVEFQCICTGNTRCESWFKHDRRHRIGGPCYIDECVRTIYAIDGEQTTPDGVLISTIQQEIANLVKKYGYVIIPERVDEYCSDFTITFEYSGKK